MTLRARYGLVVLLMTCGGILCAATIAYLTMSSTLQDGLERHLRFTLSDIRAAIEARIGIGLSLEQVRDTNDWLAAEKAVDPDILAIEVYDASGITRYSTDRGTVGQSIPESWNRATKADPSANWSESKDSLLIVGLPILNSFSKQIGGVVITYSTASRDRDLRDLITNFVSISFGLAVLAGLVGLLLARLAWRPIGDSLDLAYRRLVRLRGGDLTPPSKEELSRAAPIEAAILLEEAARSTLEQLRDGAETMRQIDEAL